MSPSVRCLSRTADFERVLKSPQRSRSGHFALHYVHSVPSEPRKPAHARPSQVASELSTDGAPSLVESVDNSLVDGRWLGSVVPKRHARRSVTRSLLKRQIREAMGRFAVKLPHGLWVVRLRAPFDRTQFPSAASQALRDAARTELNSMFEHAVRRSS